jgi:hypothetical protein
MKDSRHPVTTRAFALAFGAVLFPSLLQTDDLSCAKTGDTSLSSMMLEVDGADQIAFTSEVRSYALDVASSSGAAVLRATSTDPDGRLSYNLHNSGGLIDHGFLGIGVGEASVVLPVGAFSLLVYVKASGGASDSYALSIDRSVSGGTTIAIESPIDDERFVVGETVLLRASAAGGGPLDGSELTWSSSFDGPLGTGPSLALVGLTVGTHEIEVAGYGASASTQVRIFSDLEALYHSAPSPGEIDRIRGDFIINKISGTGVDEDWGPYDGLSFDQWSTDPTELALIARLDVLRHQRFAEPLPFTGGATIYEHLKTYIHTLNLHLECRYAAEGGGRIYFGRPMSVWDIRSNHTTEEPDLCKQPLPDAPIAEYISSLLLIVHEGRHGEPDDPGHTSCGSVPGDAMLEGGSGYAQHALYAMWVYKFGLYDPPAIKDRAKSSAATLLRWRICSTPTHSDPLVQEIVDQLLN